MATGWSPSSNGGGAAGVPGSSFNTFGLQTGSPAGRSVNVQSDGAGPGGVEITDVAAVAGTGNALTWITTGTDGAQYVTITLGSSGQFESQFKANGTLDVSGAAGILLPTANPHIAGALWNNAGTPAISAG